MTDKTKRFAEKVKSYVANREAYNYSATMRRAQKDKNFENFIQSITVNRLVGNSALAKNKYQFDYYRKDV